MQPSVADKVREHASAFMKQVTVQGPVLDVYTWLHYYALEYAALSFPCKLLF
jgi:hypothetical protein